MKIGIFTDQYYPMISGVVTSIKMLYEGLEALGHEVYIFTFHVADKDLTESQKEEINNKNVIYIKGIRYPFKAIRDYRFTFSYKKALKKIKEYNLDIIHIQTEYSIAKIALRAHKKFNIPVIHTLHTSYKDYIQYLFPHLDKKFHKQLLYLEKKLFTGPVSKSSTVEIVPTKKVIQDFELYGFKDSDVEIVPTGIEIERFSKDKMDLEKIKSIKEKYNIKDDDFIFAYIGRTSKEKNIEMLIEAFSMAFTNTKNVKFLLVGGGPELPDLKKCAKENGIENQIIFTDLVPWEEVPQYYHIFDIFLNASKSETQGLTYIEALSSSTPVLVRKDEAIDDLIFEGYNGFIFDSLEECIDKMTYIYNNKNVLDSMKDNALKSSLKYSKEIFAEAVLEIYKKAINKK